MENQRTVLGAAFLVASLLWFASLLVVPCLATRGVPAASVSLMSAGVYRLGSLVCHQKPDRSLHFHGAQLAVCARCAGLYAAAPVGAALALLLGSGRSARIRSEPRVARTVLFASALPTLLTVVLEWTQLVQPTNWGRLLAALPLGLAVAWLVGLTIRGDLR